MQDRTNLLKLFVVALIALLATITLRPASARTGAVARDFDATAAYTSMKCATCHGKQAEKKFDKTKTDDALAEVVLKGKDVKPIKMPGYEAKGVTPEQAAALVTHMRSLHP